MQERARPSWVPEIESFRAVAIALVVLFHAESIVTGRAAAVPAQTGLLGAFVLGGHTGVTLFFVLSGFLLAPPFVAEALGGKRVARVSYLQRRARRVLPAYYLFVALASVTTAKTPAMVLRGVPYLFFLQAWPGLTERLGPWSGVWWSLATEAQYYLLLPALAWLARDRRGRIVLGVGLALYAGAYVFATTGGIASWHYISRFDLFASLFGRAPAFAFGVVAALAVPKVRALAERSGRAMQPAAGVALVALVVALGALLQQVVAAGYFSPELDWNWWHLPEAALWSAIVLLVVAVPFRAKTLFCNRPVWAIGRWSYSLYLIHFPVLWISFALPGGYSRGLNAYEIGRAALVIGACIAASAASYRFVERPFFARTTIA